MEAYEHLHATVPVDVRKVKLGMVTAPGADVLPWDEERCKVPGEHKHSGGLGCECDKRAADRWNLRCSREWTRLHTRCAQRVERRLGHRPYMVLRAFEYQWRGVLHVHPVLGYSTARERAAADAYLAELERLAPEYGFGWKSGGGASVLPAGAAAAYASAYCVGKSSGHGGKRKLTPQDWVTDETAVIPKPALLGTAGAHADLWLLDADVSVTALGVVPCQPLGVYLPGRVDRGYSDLGSHHGYPGVFALGVVRPLV